MMIMIIMIIMIIIIITITITTKCFLLPGMSLYLFLPAFIEVLNAAS